MPHTTVTREDLKNSILAIKAIADAIREKKRVPAGVLYAAVMGKLSLESFEKIIDILVNAKLVKRHQSHMLEWIDPP